MNLFEYINFSDRFYSIVPDEPASKVMIADACQFIAIIGCEEIDMFISDYLVQYYLPEDAFEYRIELRKLHDSMLIEETEPIVFSCNVVKYDSELKEIHGDTYVNVNVTLEKEYRDSIDLNATKILILAKYIDFFTNHISSSLLTIEEEWRNQAY